MTTGINTLEAASPLLLSNSLGAQMFPMVPPTRLSGTLLHTVERSEDGILPDKPTLILLLCFLATSQSLRLAKVTIVEQGKKITKVSKSE